MDTLSLFCFACVAFGDPTAIPEGPGLRAQALGATTLTFRTETAQRRDYILSDGTVDLAGGLVAIDPDDGFHLQTARVALFGRPHERVGVYGAIAADSTGLHGYEGYGDVYLPAGISIRLGHWLQDIGGVSGRRIEQRAFADVPLATEHFIGRDGLLETGLRVRWRLPWIPFVLSASLLRGEAGNSFGVPPVVPATAEGLPSAGEGGDLFGHLGYLFRGQVDLGDVVGVPLWIGGFGYLNTENYSGPGNKTDLIGADVSTVLALGSAKLGLDLEFVQRGYSLPDSIYFTGGISIDAVVAWERVEAGARLDLLGIPRPEGEESNYRVSLAAGYGFTDQARVRLQYSARNDNVERNTGHELIVQAVLGIDSRIMGGGAPEAAALPAPPQVPATPPVPPSPVAPGLTKPQFVAPRAAAPESADPTDWITTALSDLEAADRADEAGDHPLSAFRAQQSAHKALTAVALQRGIAAQALERSAVGLVEQLTAAGTATPSAVAEAARELDRHYSTSRYPPELGGAPGRYYDEASSRRAHDLGRRIVSWAAGAMAPPPKPAPMPAPKPEPKPKPAPKPAPDAP